MEAITRITTEYVETEDRFRLTGETHLGATAELWIPQRLLRRLVPVLCSRIEPLEGHPREEALNAFAQLAAVQQLSPTARVVPAAQNRSCTIRAVMVAGGRDGLQLTFKEFEDVRGLEFTIGFVEAELRQWLSILYRQWVLAGWPCDFWPSWLSEDGVSAGSTPLLAN